MKKQSLKFFLCPGSDYLNQYNETGSHGQISYQFIKHLAKKEQVESIFASTIMSLKVDPIEKTTIYPLIEKKDKSAGLSPFDSLKFYIISYFKFFNSNEFKEADVVHHIIPFSYGRSFNLFFLFKNKKKKYFIGPIIGPHTNALVTADEEYVFTAKKSISKRVGEKVLSLTIGTLFTLFGKLLYILSQKTLQNADIVFFSDNHARNYHKKFMRKNQKAIILDTGIDTSIFKPASKKNPVHKELRVLFVGRLTKRKGCEYLLRAIHEAKRINRNIKIHCDVLGVGPLKKELEDLVKELDIIKEVTFLGGVKSNEDIVHNYHNTDIVCLPAISETFTVTKEAMASGKPVIVTDVCSNAERVKPGINGFVVPPMDSLAIAKVLVNLVNDPSVIEKLSKKALETRPLYDWNNIADSYLTYIT